MPTILITGAANGLGAAFVAAYATQIDTSIIAIDISPVESNHSNVQRHIVDVASEESLDRLVQEIKDRPVDLVIHSAGIRGLVPGVEERHASDVAACETMEVMDVATLTRTFHINAVGTFSLLRSLLPNLRSSKNPKVVIMSSRMGSVSNNQVPNKAAGGAYAYRASKAAMNIMVRSFAVDVPDVSFILCHPGRVETKLVKCKEEGAISAQESVSCLLPLIDQWTLKDSGEFYDRSGQSIPW